MTRRVLFGISGMHCGSCASALEARLLATKDVITAAVNHSLGLAKVELNSASSLDETALEEVIRKQGLTVYQSSPSAWHSELLKQQKTLEISLALSVFLGMWIMMLSFPFYLDVDFTPMTRTSLLWGLSLLTLTLLFTASRNIWLMAWRNLRVGIYGSDLLITIGHIAALLLSTLNILTGHHDVYFDALAMLCLAQTLSRYLEVSQAKANASSLLEQDSSHSQQVLVPSSPSGWVNIDTLNTGDEFQLSRGDSMPVDALLLSGSAYFDLSVVTGESAPQQLNIGSQLPAGAVLLDALVHVKAVSAYGETERDVQLLQAMIAMCEKPQLQNRLDHWANRWMQGLSLAFMLQLLLLFFTNQSAQDSLRQLVTVLLLGCPCALSLAAVLPLHRTAYHWKQLGVRVRSLVAVESLANVNTMVFDKTGTLTAPKLSNTSQAVLEALTTEDLGRLKVASRLSRHPASESIQHLVSQKGLPEPLVQQCLEHPGKGIEAALQDGQTLRLGSLAWLRSSGVLINTHQMGTMGLAIEKRLICQFEFEHDKQVGIFESLHALKHQGVSLLLCSGDSSQSVNQFTQGENALFTGIYAQQNPEQKRQLIQELKQQGHTVAMIGDGVNDVASSSVANLGIGFQQTAGTGLHQDLQLYAASQVKQLNSMFKQAKRTLRTCRFNLMIPVVTTSCLLTLNTFMIVPPLVVAISMFCNLALISLTSR